MPTVSSVTIYGKQYEYFLVNVQKPGSRQHTTIPIRPEEYMRLLRRAGGEEILNKLIKVAAKEVPLNVGGTWAKHVRARAAQMLDEPDVLHQLRQPQTRTPRVTLSRQPRLPKCPASKLRFVAVYKAGKDEKTLMRIPEGRYVLLAWLAGGTRQLNKLLRESSRKLIRDQSPSWSEQLHSHVAVQLEAVA